MTRTTRFLRELVLWAGGVLGALCLVSLLAGWLFNVTPLVFVSGSMSPAYQAGALGFAREVPAAGVREGDVVTVSTADGGRVTHRVVAVEHQAGRAVLTLKGDANATIDAQTYVVDAVDRVAFGVPYAGYAVSAATSPVGLVAGGLLVVGSLYLGFRPRPPRRDHRAAPRAARRHALVATGVVAAATLGGAVGMTGQPVSFTSALWSDSATANATITATTPAPAGPSVTCSVVGTNGDWKIRLDWTYGPPDPSTKFIVRSTTGGNAVPGTPVDVAKTLRTWTSTGFTSRTGQIWVVAVEGATEIASAQISYSFGPGSGNGNKLCPVP